MALSPLSCIMLGWPYSLSLFMLGPVASPALSPIMDQGMPRPMSLALAAPVVMAPAEVSWILYLII